MKNLKIMNGFLLDGLYDAAEFLCQELGLDHVDSRYQVLDNLRTELEKERAERRSLKQ